MEKRVLVGIIHRLAMGGAERTMVNILNHFTSQGKEVHLIIFENRGVLKELLDSNVIVHDLKASSVKQSLTTCLKKLYEIKPTTVFSGIEHVNIALAPFIPLMKLLLPKTRWVSRETNIVSMEKELSKYPKMLDWLYKYVYKNYDVIISQSNDMKEDLELHYPLAGLKTVVINNPINIDRVVSLSKEITANSFNKEKVNLLNISGLRQTKRHDLMLKTLAKLPENYHLTLIGSGDEEYRLKEMAEMLGVLERVKFLGHKTNPYPYVIKADLFMLTSEHEGFPNVLLEANALGLPVIAFACPGGINEIIEEGVNGFSVENGNVDAMVETIQYASIYGFNKVKIVDSIRRRYSHTIILEQYTKVFYG